MIKVIKRGIPISQPIYKGWCEVCKTQYECLREDLPDDLAVPDRKKDYFKCTQPHCLGNVWMRTEETVMKDSILLKMYEEQNINW